MAFNYTRGGKRADCRAGRWNFMSRMQAHRAAARVIYPPTRATRDKCSGPLCASWATGRTVRGHTRNAR
jgi:hypothetical protein